MALAMPVWGQDSNEGVKVRIKAGDGITVATADEKFSLNIKSNFSAGVNLEFDEDGKTNSSAFNIGKAR